MWVVTFIAAGCRGVGGCMGSRARRHGCAWVGMHKAWLLACGDSVGDIALHTRRVGGVVIHGGSCIYCIGMLDSAVRINDT